MSGSNNYDYRTLSGIPIEGIYSPEQLAAAIFDPAAELGNPGEFPFTRGAYPTMYRGSSGRDSAIVQEGGRNSPWRLT